MLIEAYCTNTGAFIAPPLPQPDDTEVTNEPCPWCDGQGYFNDSTDGYGGACGRCDGTGSIGHLTRGELRRRAFADSLFFIDAERAELIDRDCCPDCGRGGGHEWDDTCRGTTHVLWVTDAITGKDVPLIDAD